MGVELFHEQFNERSFSNSGWPGHHNVELPIPRESRGHLVDDIVDLIVYTNEFDSERGTIVALQERVFQGRVSLLVFCA
jgi:hypothetical protein